MAHTHDDGHEHDQDQGADHEHDHDALQECIEECLNCHAVCMMTAQHCLVKAGDHAHVDLVSVLLDCAEICQTSANFMLRGSPYHVVTCGACAEICRVCEEACRSLPDDEQMLHCADVCAACADHCEAMASAGEEG